MYGLFAITAAAIRRQGSRATLATDHSAVYSCTAASATARVRVQSMCISSINYKARVLQGDAHTTLQGACYHTQQLYREVRG